MFNRVFLFGIFVFFYSFVSAQSYNKEMPSIDGIDIKYKIVHSKASDKESPVQLRLWLKNTNDSDVNLKLEIEYTTGFTTKYKSGELEICIPKKSVRMGKAHGLVFELNSNDPELFSSEDTEWEFIKFEVERIEKCRDKNQ